MFLLSWLGLLLVRERTWSHLPASHLTQLGVEMEPCLGHQEDQHQESHQSASFHHCVSGSVSRHQDQRLLFESDSVGVAITHSCCCCRSVPVCPGLAGPAGVESAAPFPPLQTNTEQNRHQHQTTPDNTTPTHTIQPLTFKLSSVVRSRQHSHPSLDHWI